MIYIRTAAYNASKTLNRAVDSVLNQTFGEFRYYLVDNGSTDDGATRKIIEAYAAQDDRIVPFFTDCNHDWSKIQEAELLPHTIGDEDLFCLLDADDEYFPTFFEDMLTFMEENTLDIAACGSNFVQAGDNCVVGRRVLQSNLLLEGAAFEADFPQYHQFMRTIWGKLFKGKTLKTTLLDTSSAEMPKVYGNDTFFCLRAFGEAKRAGVLAKVLHNYYMNPKSTSYVFQPDRLRCDQILRKAALDFLRPYGEISPANRNFLNVVHGMALIDTVKVILNAQLSYLEKIEWLKKVAVEDGTRTVLECTDAVVCQCALELKYEICDWIFQQQESATEQGADAWIGVLKLLLSDAEFFNVMGVVWKRHPRLWEEIKKRGELEQIIKKYPIVSQLSEKLVLSLFDTVKYAVVGKYDQALSAYLLVKDIQPDEKDADAYYLLGQNLAALVENGELYVLLKKRWIFYLIQSGRTAEAREELQDFAEILSDDKDFQYYGELLKR